MLGSGRLSQGDWWRLAAKHLGRSPSALRCGRGSHHPSPLYTSTCHWAGDNSSESDRRWGCGRGGREWMTVKVLLCSWSLLVLLLRFCSWLCESLPAERGRDMMWIHTHHDSFTILAFYWVFYLFRLKKTQFIHSLPGDLCWYQMTLDSS